MEKLPPKGWGTLIYRLPHPLQPQASIIKFFTEANAMVFLESSTLEVKKLDSQKVLSCVWACVDVCAVRMHLCTHIYTLITDEYVGPTATHPQKHRGSMPL